MTIVNHQTGEVVEALSANDARALTDQIRQTLRVGHDLIVAAFKGRAWSALGYESWDAYCAGEFNEARMVRLDREQRLEIVAEMRQAGMSIPSISAGLGIPKSTIGSDLPVLEAQGVEMPAKVFESSGRERKASSPGSGNFRPRSGPDDEVSGRTVHHQRATRRAPLTDFAFDASVDLLRVAERLVRVVEDDRFKDNRAAIAQRAAGQINRAAELIAAAQAAINSETAP